ncbi:uncharacterized protein LOC105848372 [Hydra vulgaris]|uniref:uncharacterized protein LOC105848372 n=1 Tax=Hydra vulgaris TaxID=6087 RepID=UPI001F5FD720|nr:uncharacterized protein LOC105848372 [Hydra vulgaris]
MERENIVSGEQFVLSTGGNLLSVTVGVNENKSKRKKVNQVSFQIIMELSNVLELSKNKTKKLCSTLRSNLTGVESNINIKMTELQDTLETLYKCKTEEFLDGDEIVVRDIVYVKNSTEFIKFIIDERGIDTPNAIARISIDGGQNFLKVIINVFDPKNHYSSSEMYKDSGVKRCFILAIVEMVSEDNGNLQKLLELLKLEEVDFSLAFDLKCANSVFGLSSHSGKYACLYCEGECSLKARKLRTLGSIDLCYDQYVCEGKKRRKMQDYKNVINPRLIYLKENQETILEHIVPPPELHIMMGVVDKLCTMLLCVWPPFQNWLKTHYILMRGYHGVGLDGNNANKFMSLLDVLERDVTLTATIDILPIINCVRKFSLVKLAVFGLEMGADISAKIEDFKCSFSSLQLYAKDIFDYDLKVSWKIHILVCHILPSIEHNNISLGNYAEQCGEAVHHIFKKTWVNFKITIGHKNYGKKLKFAVVNFNLNNQ